MTLQWVVMEAKIGVGFGTRVWAWCLCSGSAGFDEIRFTATDGQTPVDIPDGQIELGAHLFTVHAQPGQTDSHRTTP